MPLRPGAVSTMFIVSRPQPSLDEIALGRAHHLGGAAAGLVGVEEDLEAALVDAHRVAHRLELRLALDGAREVELHLEVHEFEPARGPSESRTFMM